MALLGWVPGTESQLQDPSQPRFIHNTSGRFECRWANVNIQEDSPAIMLKVSSELLYSHESDLRLTASRQCDRAVPTGHLRDVESLASKER